MSRLTNLRVEELEAASALENLFAFAEQKWCQWDKLEESIAKVDYEKLPEEELDWFVEFLANCVMRVWRSSKEDPELNRVKEKDMAFVITNYDWNAYKFCVKNGADKLITTKNVIGVDGYNLTEKEVKWLRSKCE